MYYFNPNKEKIKNMNVNIKVTSQCNKIGNTLFTKYKCTYS